MTIVVSPAERADLARVAEIERRSFADPWSAQSFREAYTNPHVLFLCAREAEGGEGAGVPTLGYVVAWFVADEGEIANLAVDPDVRRRGIGAMLLDAALGEGARRGATAIYLEVRESNAAARRLYESRGFVEVGRRPGYYRRPVEDAVVLRCALASAVANAAR